MHNQQKSERKHNRRRKYYGTQDKPRLTVFRSNKFFTAQIIDDAAGKTLVGIAEDEKASKGTKSEKAKSLGQEIAKKAIAMKIKQIIFDKGRYAYHGRVKAFADGAREGGLNF